MLGPGQGDQTSQEGVVNVSSSASSTISTEEAANNPSGVDGATPKLSNKDFRPSYEKGKNSAHTTSRGQALVSLTMLYTP